METQNSRNSIAEGQAMSLEYLAQDLCGRCGTDGVEVKCFKCKVYFHRKCVQRFEHTTAVTGLCDVCYANTMSQDEEDLNSTRRSMYLPNFNPKTNSTSAEEFELLKKKCESMERELRRLTMGPGQLPAPLSPLMENEDEVLERTMKSNQDQDQSQGAGQNNGPAQGEDRIESRSNRNQRSGAIDLLSSFGDEVTGNTSRVSWKEQVSHLNSTFNLDETIILTKSQRELRKTLDTTLPRFCGEPRQWVRFVTTFSSTTASCGFTDSENRKRLKSALYGDALHLVQDKLEHQGTLDTIMQRLVQAFGQRHQLMKGVNELVKKMPRLQDDLGNLAEFVGIVEDIDDIFKVAKKSSENAEVLSDIEERLPMINRREWYRIRRSGNTHSVTHLVKYLNEVMDDAVDMGLDVLKRTRTQQPAGYNKEKSANVSPATPSRMMVMSNQCPAPDCNKQHELEACQVFLKNSGADRWKIVKQKNRCKRCLGPHFKSQCTSTNDCGVDGCKGQHHRLLHFPKINQPQVKPQSTTDTSKTQIPAHTLPTMVMHKHNKTTHYCVVPVILRNGSKAIKTHAFLDGGGSSTLLSTSVSRFLGLSGERAQLPLQWADGKTMMIIDTESVTLQISGTMESAEIFNIGAQTMDSLSLPRATVTPELLHEEELPEFVEYFNDAAPQILIGQDNVRVKRALRSYLGKTGKVAEVETPIGWYIEGEELRTGEKFTAGCMFMVTGHSVEDKLEQLVTRYIEQDEFGLVDPDKVILESDEVLLARQILDRETVFKHGRFETAMLWKPRLNPMFPDNRQLVLNRHLKFEHQMDKTEGLWPRMCVLMDEFEKKGYIRRVQEEERKITMEKTWYLNIFTVFNPMKPEKLRFVWDAAAKYFGVSLNDMLMSGPDLTVPLIDILCRFRAGQYAVTGDIQEMFLQIGIKEEDRSALRFFWRNKAGDNMMVFESCRAIFGATCSPTQAQYVKNVNARRWMDSFPKAAAAIEQDHYVDDFMKSDNSEADLAKLVIQVKELHARGGFNIHKWATNSGLVRATMGLATEFTTQELVCGQECSVLGMFWDTVVDTLRFKMRTAKMGEGFLEGTAQPTMRMVLRTTMSFYDPLGLISFEIIELKLIMRETWREKMGWDDKLSSLLTERWNMWGRSSKSIEEVRIPRWTGTTGAVEFHIFCDASESAMAAVGYVVELATRHRRIVLAKCRVAPLKAKSVPRLELDAAVLGVKVLGLMQRTTAWQQVSGYYLWTDARDVLYWLRSRERKYSVYVANRVSTILAATPLSSWRWVPTEENPADMATKYKPKGKLEDLWWNGPQFLGDHQDDWPQGVPEPDQLLEIRTVAMVRTIDASVVPDVSRFSKWLDLIRACALVRVAADVWLKRRSRTTELCAADERWGRDQVLKQIQAECHVEQWKKLSPFEDENGIWRCRGRAAKGDFVYDQRFPVLLGDHPATRLLIAYYHHIGNHQNYFRCLNEIRGEFMIPHLRGLANRVIRSCQTCKVMKAHPVNPEMAALPKCRLAVGYPVFAYVGVDAFGPMEVTQLRRKVKRWGILFTCLTTRAVYIELVESMSTNSCVIAVESFMTRRNRRPVEFVSDNGTNFQGAAKLMRDKSGELFNWRFNPPGCPHMGGAWERLIGAAKRAMQRMDFSALTKEEELRRALLIAERIINSRPLTEYPVDEDTGVCLTPQDILEGSVPGDNVKLEDFLPELAMKAKQQVIQQFWDRWVKEYLPSLHQRSKWQNKSEPLAVGSLVYLCDSDVRSGWVRGVVDEIWRDAESNQVRQVMVRTASGKRYRRGVHHVAEIRVTNKLLE